MYLDKVHKIFVWFNRKNDIEYHILKEYLLNEQVELSNRTGLI